MRTLVSVFPHGSGGLVNAEVFFFFSEQKMRNAMETLLYIFLTFIPLPPLSHPHFQEVAYLPVMINKDIFQRMEKSVGGFSTTIKNAHDSFDPIFGYQHFLRHFGQNVTIFGKGGRK